MVTTGGWAYCGRCARLLSARATLLRPLRPDRYVSVTTRALRHLDWGNRAYLAGLAQLAASKHRQVSGKLVLIGVSYSGFGVATRRAPSGAAAPTG